MNRRRIVSALVAAVALAAGGCFEEKRSYTVHSDGSGSFRFSFESPFGIGKMTKEKPTQEQVEQSGYGALAKWEGVVAWTDVKIESKEKGASIVATGWFEDVTKVKTPEVASPIGVVFTKNDDGTYTCEIPSKKKAESAAPKKEPLDEEAGPEFVREAMKKLKVEVEVRFPGAVTKAEKMWKTEGNVARFAIDGAELTKAEEKLGKERDALKAAVAEGEMTREKANEKLKARRKELVPFADVEEEKIPVRATGKADEAKESLEAARKALAEAKKGYAGSELEKKIQAAAASAPPKAK